MSKLYKNVVVLDSGAGFFALLVVAPAPEVPGAAQFQLMELLQSLAQQGRTVVMVLHDLAHAMQYSDAVGVFADGKLAAFAEPSQLYEQKIWEEAFQVKLCKALDGTYYIKPLERNVLFHAVAPIVSKTELLQNEKQEVPTCWVSVKQFSKNDTATACQDWLRSTRLGRGSIKSHVRTVKVLGMGLFAFQERIHLWKGVTH
jgi:ABC-type Fe3+/spermidine/putrescine transport system ATPase subunit